MVHFVLPPSPAFMHFSTTSFKTSITAETTKGETAGGISVASVYRTVDMISSTFPADSQSVYDTST